MEQINLNIIPSGILPIVHASQYDTGRQIQLNLYEGKTAYTLSGAETLELDVKKPDGTIVTTLLSNTSGSQVVISLELQMTTAVGKCKCNLKITNGLVSIGSMNFIIEIEESPLNGGIDSESSIYNLEAQVEDIIESMPTGTGGLVTEPVNFYLVDYVTLT